MRDTQLFCFTYAGGTASFFDIIEKELDGIEVVKLEYSGHGTRHREPLFYSFEDLSEDIYNRLKKQYKGGPYALFGYSMGTITLVEILKRILNDPEIGLPGRVFLAAHEPHSKTELSDFSPDILSDEWVKERTIAFGAVPEQLVNNNSFWRFYLPLYRADYCMIGNYKFEKLELKTTVPATIFYSETDTPRKEMELWQNFFAGECEFRCFEGKHFFIQQHHKEMADIIQKRLNSEERS